jgi:HKD family nuclease
MQLVDNTRESLAAFLAAQLTHASDVLIHVAYLRQSGVAVLETELQEFLVLQPYLTYEG